MKDLTAETATGKEIFGVVKDSHADEDGRMSTQNHLLAERLNELKSYAATHPRMFEIDKYYKHNGGGTMHILCSENTDMWGETLVAERCGRGNTELTPICNSEDATAGWIEIDRDEWMTNFSEDDNA